MTEKKQQFTFDKGITNVPSDALCSDNTLEESIGMVYDNGEHRVIQKPVEDWVNSTPVLNLPTIYSKLLYVHRYGDNVRYIFVYPPSAVSGYSLSFKTNRESTSGTRFYENLPTNDITVESIGKTLILNVAGTGIMYFLWDDTIGKYRYLGNKIPEYSVRFMVSQSVDNDITYNDKYVVLEGLLDGITVKLVTVSEGGLDVTYQINGNAFKNGMYESAKSALIGLVSMRLQQVHENGRFAFPFWARSAMRLYDGSYIHISDPFLLLPTVRYNRHIFTCNAVGDPKYGDQEGKAREVSQGADTFHGGDPETNYKPYYSKLYYAIYKPNDYADWEDIISGIDIFVSEEVKTFDMEGQWTCENVCNPIPGQDLHNSQINPYYGGTTKFSDYCSPLYGSSKLPLFRPDPTYAHTWTRSFKPDNLSDEDIMNKLLDASVFYKILEVDNSEIIDGYVVDTSTKMMKNTLVNLVTQDQLEYDDYFSYSKMQATVMKTYNSRLHLADIKRSVFGGFRNFSYTAYDNSFRNYVYYIYVNTPSGLKVVKGPEPTDWSGSRQDINTVWFYYPDPRAYQVKIYRYDIANDAYFHIATLPLKEHHRLHGAYYFGHLPDGADTYHEESASEPTYDTSPKEILENTLMVSEVDNPFVFTAKGEITTNLGKIIGIATQTMSLGEQEHGIHPLTVFSERGISLLRVTDVGTYSRADEISREVCNNKNSITETDGPVFFSSDKGLMVVSGAQVKCVSEQLSGKTRRSNSFGFLPNRSVCHFNEYLKRCKIAYDYRDSMLWIFDPYYLEDCFVYSIKSGTFGKHEYGTFTITIEGETETFPDTIYNIVNDYPDFLLQGSSSKISSLIHRPDINSDNKVYSAKMLSRPMKLEDALALKAIMQVRHIKDFYSDTYTVQESDGHGGTITVVKNCLEFHIYASNNLKNWVELTSLRGTPWKYYRFGYDFSHLKATDLFSGTIAVTQERRTDKLR